MRTLPPTTLLNPWRLLGLLLLATGPSVASAAPESAAASAEATYRSERAACLAGDSAQDRRSCLCEAAAVRAEARRSPKAATSPQTLAENARRRCAVHVDPDAQAACARMAAGEGSSTGSTAGGGVLKSLTTVTPAPAAPASAPR
jgi:hypothetical protein